MRRNIIILSALGYWFASGVLILTFVYLGIGLFLSLMISSVFYAISTIILILGIKMREIIKVEKRICSVCGNEVSRDALFCDVCLSPLD